MRPLWPTLDRKSTYPAVQILQTTSRGQEAGGGPAFLVGLPGKVWPVHLDGGKAELVEEQGQPGAVNALGHAAARVGWLSSAS